MYLNRLSSVLLSFFLHLGMLALVLFWPISTATYQSLGESISVSVVTLGKRGKLQPTTRPPAKENLLQNLPHKKIKYEKPVPAPAQKKFIDPVKKKPLARPESFSIPAAKKTELDSDSHKVTKSFEEEKVKLEAIPEKKADAEKGAIPVEKKDSKKASVEKNKGIKKEITPKNKVKKEVDLNKVLAEMAAQTDDNANSGTGPGGIGGIGDTALVGAYKDSLVSRVRQNWSWAGRADRVSLVATVHLKISSNGKILDYTIKEPSGNTLFDSSVLQAIAKTENLEPPPKKLNGEIDVQFTPTGNSF